MRSPVNQPDASSRWRDSFRTPRVALGTASQTVRYTCPIPEVTRLRAKGDVPEFVLRGRVDYGDMWGNSHYANFRFYQDLDPSTSDGAPNLVEGCRRRV